MLFFVGLGGAVVVGFFVDGGDDLVGLVGG